MKTVGGKTNERLRAEITRRWGIKSLIRYDPATQTVRKACSYKFATVKELRETIANLEYYPLT